MTEIGSGCMKGVKSNAFSLTLIYETSGHCSPDLTLFDVILGQGLPPLRQQDADGL